MKNNLTQVYRDVKTSNYSMISNEVLKRPDLSWKAKGIMAYILSLPDDWTIYLEELEKHATDGKASFRAGWNELKAKGYVERKPIRDDKKIIAWQTIVHESVGTQGTELLTDFQEVGNQEVENLLVDNQKLLITNNTNNLNKQTTSSIGLMESDFEKLWELYPRKEGKKEAFKSYVRIMKIGKTTNKQIQNGIVAYAKCVKADNTEKKYIKQGGTFFNGECWNDQYESGEANPLEQKYDYF